MDDLNSEQGDHDQNKVAALPIQWDYPDDIKTRYTTNIVVQHTEDEFIVSFFELMRPPLFGTPEENMERLKDLGSVSAECVARLVISPSRMKEFINALQENYNRFVDNE